MKSLSQEELVRYSRHFAIPEVGEDGQMKLKNSSVLVVGAGGLGSPAAIYLAAAGVGRIGLADFDEVDETNLHRQILHFERDVGTSKLESAFTKLSQINSNVELAAHPDGLTADNAIGIISDYDLVVDGTDNFVAKYLINDVCIFQKKPNVYGSIFRFEGQVSVFGVVGGPCYRCLYPVPPPPGEVPNCADAGVLGVLPGIIGCLQAAEAIKLLLRIGNPLVGTLLSVDALSMDFRRFQVARRSDCAVCGDSPAITRPIDYNAFCGARPACGSPGASMEVREISVQQLAEKRREDSSFVLLDVREPYELKISKLEPCVHIPMDQVAMRLGELDKAAETLVLCRTGNRSGQITHYLREQGFLDVKNVAGGINAYAKEVDGSLRSY